MSTKKAPVTRTTNRGKRTPTNVPGLFDGQEHDLLDEGWLDDELDSEFLNDFDDEFDEDFVEEGDDEWSLDTPSPKSGPPRKAR